MRYAIFILMLMMNIPVKAQEIAFNIFNGAGYKWSAMEHMVVDNDTIVGYGRAIVEEGTLKFGIVVAKFDSNGVLLDTMVVKDSSIDVSYHILDNYGGIITTDDGGYALTAYVGGTGAALLIKLYHDLEVEFIKEYYVEGQPGSDYTVKETGAGYALYGSLHSQSRKLVAFIKHVDKQGEELWQREFGENLSTHSGRIIDLEVVGDKIYAVGGHAVSVTWPYTSKFFIEVLDMEGNTVRSWLSELDPETGFFRSIIDVIGEDMLFYTLTEMETVNNLAHVQSTVYRVNEDFETEWLYRFGDIQNINHEFLLRRFVTTPDGRYLGIGQRGFFDGDGRKGWMYHISPLGDSIWQGKIPVPEEGVSGSGYLNDGGVLSSGSIVASGKYKKGNESFMWLVKLYCSDTLFCGEPFVSGTNEIDERYQLSISPNPAAENLTVGFHPSADFQRLRVLGLDGREHLAQAVSGQQATVGISNLPPGVYVLRAEGERGFSNKKFVKE